jgi:hypothetical protein
MEAPGTLSIRNYFPEDGFIDLSIDLTGALHFRHSRNRMLIDENDHPDATPLTFERSGYPPKSAWVGMGTPRIIVWRPRR